MFAFIVLMALFYVLLNMFVNLEMLREVIMCLFVYFQVIMKLLVDEEL